jgi:predicted unusual protein kinase regulating ubiquinone biosynthesis (AarF/ABC1/UbiB family)
MAGGIAGRAALGSARALATGQRPDAAALLLSPGNIRRVTDQLADLRGAAMKMGQLISMDTGDFLPPELSEIMARLRADGQAMPPKQLRTVLDRGWGKGWLSRFARFDVRPIAAASIGQVHRAWMKDGTELAVKVQYPGVRASIDSDVDNVATLMRLSGLVPGHLDTSSMLSEAKRQLHEEADYAREADCLARFHALLADSPDFVVPRLHGELTTPDILTMDYVPGEPIEALAEAPQDVRDAAMTRLIGLVFRELFEFRLMQTDPNFANYRWNRTTGQIVLLDFGATREISPEIAARYHQLMVAGLEGDRAATRNAAVEIGFFGPDTGPDKQDRILDLFEAAFAPVKTSGTFDFSSTDIAARVKDDGLALAQDRDFWHIPPVDTLFLQRKFGGLFLLGARLKARVDVRAMMAQWAGRLA